MATFCTTGPSGAGHVQEGITIEDSRVLGRTRRVRWWLGIWLRPSRYVHSLHAAMEQSFESHLVLTRSQRSGHRQLLCNPDPRTTGM